MGDGTETVEHVAVNAADGDGGVGIADHEEDFVAPELRASQKQEAHGEGREGQ